MRLADAAVKLCQKPRDGQRVNARNIRSERLFSSCRDL